MMQDVQPRQKAFLTVGEWDGRTVHVTRRVYQQAIGTDPDFTGFDGATMRALALVEAFAAAASSELRSNPESRSVGFSHKFADRDWNGDPEKIEDQRIALVATVSNRSVTIDFNVRRVSFDKSDEARWVEMCSKSRRSFAKDV
ncbi:hypothetical protein IC232_03905 [Microvirga sp. BT688]|uniref:hypothetical protein n=1 Tax=Microvirga sp. TaxID=1873136 RepID=UPI00168845BF|nr:hypothetical protein [Microvirga sp.]MBD2745836.1 hypothetical protein [Microvirga sp.]